MEEGTGPLPHESDLLRLLVQSVRDYAIFLLAPDGTILTWNAGAERIKHYRADEIIGRHFATFYTVEDLLAGKPAWELAEAAEKGSVEDEGWRIRKDGSRFFANVVITALRDEGGKLQGFAKVTRDLTERRRAEEILRESEERLRLLIESVVDYAIFMLDPEGRVATWNAGAQRLKQYTASEILGQSFTRFYPPADVESGRPQVMLAKARDLGLATEEGWRLRKDGSLFWGHVTLTAVHDPQGSLRGYTKVTRDLTEQRAAEEERLRLVHTEEALRLRDEFLSIASHELKTPLTGLMLRLQNLLRRIGDAPQREQLLKAIGQGQRLSTLVESLLDVSHIATGQLHIEPSPCDLGKLVRETIEQLSDPLQRAKCKVTLEAPDGIVGQWDASRLAQVVTNLLGNALKYGAGRPIEVKVESTPTGARLSVTDHGIGIAAADRERVFGRFERAVPVAHFGGLGLGLYVSRQIVDAHGGTLTVASEPQRVTTFVVELPRAAVAIDPAIRTG